MLQLPPGASPGTPASLSGALFHLKNPGPRQTHGKAIPEKPHQAWAVQSLARLRSLAPAERWALLAAGHPLPRCSEPANYLLFQSFLFICLLAWSADLLPGSVLPPLIHVLQRGTASAVGRLPTARIHTSTQVLPLTDQSKHLPWPLQGHSVT